MNVKIFVNGKELKEQNIKIKNEKINEIVNRVYENTIKTQGFEVK